MAYFAVLNGTRQRITPSQVEGFQSCGIEVLEIKVSTVPPSDVSKQPADVTITARFADSRVTKTLRLTDAELSRVHYLPEGDDAQPVPLADLVHEPTPDEIAHRRMIKGALEWSVSVKRRKAGQRGRLSLADIEAFESLSQSEQDRWIASANA